MEKKIISKNDPRYSLPQKCKFHHHLLTLMLLQTCVQTTKAKTFWWPLTSIIEVNFSKYILCSTEDRESHMDTEQHEGQ